MSKNSEKTWSQGYHIVPSTSKYLAGDPDLKFVVFDTSPDSNSEEEKTDPDLEEETRNLTWEVKSQNQQPVDSKETTHLIPQLTTADSDSVDYSSNTYNDIPLSPSTRKDIVEFLNCCIEGQVNIEDEC